MTHATRPSAIVALALVLTLAACGGAGGGGGGGGGAAASETLWKDGASGTFLGDTPSIVPATGSSTVTTVSATNGVTGDTHGLQVSGTSVGFTNGLRLATLSPHDATAYTAGHIQFDLRADIAGLSTLSVGYAVLFNGSPTFNLTALDPALVPVGGFTHVSLPISGFTGGSTHALTLVTVPFYIAAGGAPSSSPGAVFTVDNVRWTE